MDRQPVSQPRTETDGFQERSSTGKMVGEIPQVDLENNQEDSTTLQIDFPLRRRFRHNHMANDEGLILITQTTRPSFTNEGFSIF